MSHAAVVLAAGLGTRFRVSGGTGPSKVTSTFAGVPLVRRAAQAALAARAHPVIVVTGHARAEVEAALAGLPIATVWNPAYASGMASSVRAGIEAVPTDALGAVVLLADMPMITPQVIGRLLDEAAAGPAFDAVVPVTAGRRGNPVLLSRAMFPAVARLEGDAGARHLLREPTLNVCEIRLDDAATAFDIDEPADLDRLQHLVDRKLI